jgi:hypothetical protein
MKKTKYEKLLEMKETIYDMYLIKYWSISTIAKELSMPTSYIQKVIAFWGISRPVGTHKGSKKNFWSKF